MRNVITHNKHQLIGDNILISPYRMVFNMYTTVHRMSDNLNDPFISIHSSYMYKDL